MQEQQKPKISTLRHFLFYMGMAALMGAIIGVVSRTMSWSSGLTFAAAVVGGTALCTFAVRKGLFPHSKQSQSSRRA